MKIEQIDRQTIKVILSPLDMDRFDLTYEEMDYKDPNTKRVILELLHRIKQETDLDLNDGRLFVEAFPYLNGGCVLYICTVSGELPPKSRTVQKRTSGFNTPLVFGFKSLELLSAACEHLVLQYNHIILKSALYLYETEYRLLIYSYFKLDDRLIALVSEYGRYIGKGAVPSSVVKEHAKCLLDSGAIETISEKLA